MNPRRLKQYRLFKLVEFQRILDIYIQKMDSYLEYDEMKWIKELHGLKTFKPTPDSHAYTLLTDMFDLSHEEKLKFITDFYQEIYDDLIGLSFEEALNDIAFYISTLEDYFSPKDTKVYSPNIT